MRAGNRPTHTTHANPWSRNVATVVVRQRNMVPYSFLPWYGKNVLLAVKELEDGVEKRRTGGGKEEEGEK